MGFKKQSNRGWNLKRQEIVNLNQQHEESPQNLLNPEVIYDAEDINAQSDENIG